MEAHIRELQKHGLRLVQRRLSRCALSSQGCASSVSHHT
jgi:hypothetical protein